MAKLSWLTPVGSLVNVLTGIPITYELQAFDTANNGATLTYKLISGELPNGLTLDSSGVIRGTPISAVQANYTSTTPYKFIVRVVSSNGYVLDGSFSIILTNVVNNDFLWVTPAGDLGTVPAGNFYSLQLQTEIAQNLPVTYTLVSGELPAGMRVTTYTATGVVTSPSTNSNIVYLDTTQYINVGYLVYGPGIPAGTTVTEVAGYSITLSTEVNTVSTTTLSFYSQGILQGVPTFLNPIAVDQSQEYRFTVRATSSAGHVTDQTFSLTITNVFGPVIEPNNTNLGTFFDGSYYNQQLSVAELNPAVQIQWSVKEGTLPPGVELSSTGLLSGYIQPLQLVGSFGPGGYDGYNGNDVGLTGTFTNCTINGTTLVIGTGSSLAADQMVLSGVGVFPGTQIVGKITDWIQNQAYAIGDIATYQGSFYKAIQTVPPSEQFNLSDWTPVSGVQSLWRVTPSQHLTTPTTITGVVLDTATEQGYGASPFDFPELNQSLGYSFTIQAYDGANYDTQSYTIEVVSRSGFTADNSTNLVNDTYLTADALDVYTPVLLNTATTLPVGRAGSYYAFKFDGYDFSNDAFVYVVPTTVGTFDTYVTGQDQGFDYAVFDESTLNQSVGVSTANLPGLFLDAQSGWLYGQIQPQSSAIQNYEFGVSVSKTINGVTYASRPIFFTLPVLGDVNNLITWNTASNLGSINNGAVSDLSISATSLAGKAITYSLYDAVGVSARLPQGLKLLPSGAISGRVSFKSFNIDENKTTFDGARLTIDRTYTFTAVATTVDNSASSYQQFTIDLNQIDEAPYENLYLTAMPAYDQRQIFNSVVNNTEILDPNLIYRSDDPWFGVNQNISMLFLPGLTTESLTAYEQAIALNHWTKTYNFDSIKTAVVLDNNYNVKYEVVYIQIVDPGETLAGKSPKLKLDLSGTIANPYIDAAGNDFKVIYPNSSTNMIERLVAGIGYYDQSSLPDWMTSNQPGASGSNTFSPPLGYTQAVVLAYTVPGASKLIAYRLKSAGITFNNIEFTVDRYSVDNYYSTNFQGNAWINGVETTFDALPRNNVGSIVAEVNFGVNVPFDQINGRPVSYINNNGGIDGSTNFTDGQTLVFAKQENYGVGTGPYDGWVDYFDSYIGDNITTPTIEGYDSEGYDKYSVVPGFLEFSLGSQTIIGSNQVRSYNINQYVTGTNQISVTVNGTMLASTDYTVNGSLLTFNNYPANLVLPPQMAQITIYNNGNEQNLTGNGVQTTFTLANVVATPTSVLVNGIIQSPSDYTITTNVITATNSITFSTPPQEVILPEVPPTIVISSTNSATNVNQRGGIWKINIINGVVSLEFVEEIKLNQRVQVLNGSTYGGAILYYNPTLKTGQTVPAYTVFRLSTNAVVSPTSFNNGTTKFFSNRDQYYTPGSQDQYLKFPQTGPFQ